MIFNQFSMDTADKKLLEDDEQNPRPKIKDIVKQFYIQRHKEETDSAKYISDKGVKLAFDILLKLAYGLFALGAFLTVESNTVDQQAILVYFQSTRNQAILFVLIVLGVLELSFLRIIKEENQFQPLIKKKLNFVVDIVRSVIYTILIVFVYPFVFDNNNWALNISFWSEILATLIFIARKILKWRYFLFDNDGKKVLQPWVGVNVNKKQNLSKFAEFLEYIMEKKLGLKGTNINKNFQRVEQLQRSVVENLKNQKSLLDSITQSNS